MQDHGNCQLVLEECTVLVVHVSAALAPGYIRHHSKLLLPQQLRLLLLPHLLLLSPRLLLFLLHLLLWLQAMCGTMSTPTCTVHLKGPDNITRVTVGTGTGGSDSV